MSKTIPRTGRVAALLAAGLLLAGCDGDGGGGGGGTANGIASLGQSFVAAFSAAPNSAPVNAQSVSLQLTPQAQPFNP